MTNEEHILSQFNKLQYCIKVVDVLGSIIYELEAVKSVEAANKLYDVITERLADRRRVVYEHRYAADKSNIFHADQQDKHCENIVIKGNGNEAFIALLLRVNYIQNAILQAVAEKPSLPGTPVYTLLTKAIEPLIDTLVNVRYDIFDISHCRLQLALDMAAGQWMFYNFMTVQVKNGYGYHIKPEDYEQPSITLAAAK